MTDRVTLTLAEFETLWPDKGRGDARVAAGLSDWIERSACPVIDDLWSRPDFRRLARWSLDNLSMGARTAERKLVNEIDEQLVEARKATAELFAQPRLRETSEPLTTDPPKRRRNKKSDVQRTDTAPEQFRPWHDLVATNDYFGPARDLNLNREAYSEEEYVPCAECLPYFNASLRPLGDFVHRMLFARVKFWTDVLQSNLFRRRDDIRQAGLDKSQAYQRAREALNAVRERAQTLRDCCLSGNEPKLRNACTTLAQVYAAYRPAAELAWLGVISRAARSPAEVRYRLEQRRELSIALQVAAALREIASLANKDLDPQELCKEKSRIHELVICPGAHGRGLVYWRQNPLDVDWSDERLAWLFMLALARGAMRDRSVGPEDIDEGYTAALKHLKLRLTKLLPQYLADLVDPADKGRYKLQLDAKRICVLEQRESRQLVGSSA